MNVTPQDSDEFSSLFCERFDCSVDEFEMELFWRAIPQMCMPLAVLLHSVSPGFFRLDLSYIRRLAQAQNKREFATLINALRAEPDFRHGILRGFLRVRISGRRLARLAAMLFKVKTSRREPIAGRVSIFLQDQPTKEAA